MSRLFYTFALTWTSLSNLLTRKQSSVLFALPPSAFTSAHKFSRRKPRVDMDDLSPKQCICTNLHINCNPDTCIEAARRKAATFIVPPIIQEEPSELLLRTTLESIRRAMNKGCMTCTLVFRAVTANLPEQDNWHLKYHYKEILVSVHSGRQCLEIWTRGYEEHSQEGDEYRVVFDKTTYRLLFVETGKSYW